MRYENRTNAESRTQLFVGNDLADFLRFDFATGIGVLGISYLKSTIPTKVWEEPYLLGTKRGKTDRSSNGFALNWEQIFGSNFAVKLRSRKIDIDDELSGNSDTADCRS